MTFILPDDCPGRTVKKGESFYCPRFIVQRKSCKPCNKERKP